MSAGGPAGRDREAAAPLARRLAEWAAGLHHADVPERVQEYATSQVMSHLAVVRASLGHPLGRKLVKAFGTPLSADPGRAAQVMAALSSCLYYEDSMYAGHVTHSSVGVPLAFRRVQQLDGRALLTAVVAANECAARVTAAAVLGPLRGQGTSYTQLVGAVAARLHGAGEPARRWTDAWGLALAMPPWPLRRAVVGSDAKVLSAAAPVRTALDACDAAAAGLRGADDILEHPGGLFAKFAHVPSPEVVTAGLGTRWHTETLTFKMYPAGAYVDAAVECAAQLHARLSADEIRELREIVVSAARLTIVMDQEGAPYLDRERSAVMALNVCVAYNVATALTTGSVVPCDLAEPALADPLRWSLADRVRLEYDAGLSRRVLRMTAPLGEALRQAGDRGREWFADFMGAALAAGPELAGPPSSTFQEAGKAVGARLRVTLGDGRTITVACERPRGSAGPATRAAHRELVREKLTSSGSSADVVEALEGLASLDAPEVDELVGAALSEPLPVSGALVETGLRHRR
ncbi:MmgE/PrpD family protein [Streptomyces spectabilis]|uniref:MmgE/PrpD family protein n=1 Tax=Streptomyces spectabilis TaxID=68270 RepID=A0A516R1Z2_STRST|nr:MmgE/PrpD family protein [Streptomyces spectabilis]QDQ09676.1 MmgE/PrpD family protein [Streptomyces spectabilis]